MGNKFLDHLREENWDKAIRTLNRIRRLDTLFSALKSLYENVSRAPLALIQGILSKAKILLSVENTSASISASRREFTRYLTDQFVSRLIQDAPVETLRLFLRELAGMHEAKCGKYFIGVKTMFRFKIIELWRDSARDAQRKLKATIRDALLNVSSISDLCKYPELHLLWQRTELLLRAAMNRDVDNPSKDGRKWLVAHAITEIKCPTIVLWLALKLYPSQVRQRDSTGSLPLHYAAHYVGLGSIDFYGFQFPDGLQEANMSLIPFLLSRFPEGARYADRSGQLPLSIALKKDARYGSASTSGYLDKIRNSAIEALATASPEALVTRDPVTRFYPYQAAAAQGVELGMIYKLLVENPELLKHRTMTISEIQIEKLHSDNLALQEQNAKLREELNRSREENERLRMELGSVSEGSANRKRPRTG